MQIYISKSFSDILSSGEYEIANFNDKINQLKYMSKTDIIYNDNTIELSSKGNITLYAYNIQTSVYVLLAFKDKNSLILLDVIELVGKDKIKSLVYPDSIPSS